MRQAEADRALRRSPFSQRNFRLQWPADLVTSLAFEMETLILGWFVLTATESVVWLTVFGALQFTGTLLAPMLGVGGDRVGHRRLLAAMRLSYLLVASCVAGMAVAGMLSPAVALMAAAVVGLIRPSDIGVRNTLIAATLPASMLPSALGVSRASTDGARILGALAGAGSMATLGVGPAYGIVMALYLIGMVLTLGIREPPVAAPGIVSRSLWRDLADGVALARGSPALLAALWLAWLVNFVAYPLSGGLLPHVAREVYGLDRTGLALLAASFAVGALLGSLTMSVRRAVKRPGLLMMAAAAGWFTLLIAFAHADSVTLGMALLVIAGFVQSFCMIPMSVLLLQSTEASFRGRVIGLRMLSIYGLPLGLLLAGFGIEHVGFAAMATLYGGFGLLATGLIAWRWRATLRGGEA